MRLRKLPAATYEDYHNLLASVTELAQRSYREQKMIVFDPDKQTVIPNPQPRRDVVKPA